VKFDQFSVALDQNMPICSEDTTIMDVNAVVDSTRLILNRNGMLRDMVYLIPAFVVLRSSLQSLLSMLLRSRLMKIKVLMTDYDVSLNLLLRMALSSSLFFWGFGKLLR